MLVGIKNVCMVVNIIIGTRRENCNLSMASGWWTEELFAVSWLLIFVWKWGFNLFKPNTA